MFDLQPYLEAETVLQHVETVRALEAIRPPQAILSHLEQSGVFVHSHDDCYLYIETREREQAVGHLVNLLKQYATYRLGRTVSSPTFELARAALEKSGSLVIDEREEVRCGSRLPMRLVSEDQGETVLNLDQSTGIWSAAASNV